jgi:hypothetical protein
MEVVTNPCALAFWKGGFLVGGAMVLLVFVALSVGVLIARK